MGILGSEENLSVGSFGRWIAALTLFEDGKEEERGRVEVRKEAMRMLGYLWLKVDEEAIYNIGTGRMI